jgi:tRNA G18 (ribose-2'-O)-methylase SpoU
MSKASFLSDVIPVNSDQFRRLCNERTGRLQTIGGFSNNTNGRRLGMIRHATVPHHPSDLPNPGMPRIAVHDLADPVLDAYRHLKHTNSTRWSGRFIIEGHRCVRRLLASRFETLSVVASDRRVHLIEKDVPPETDLYVISEELARELVGFHFHSGVMACGRREPPQDWKDVLPRSQAPALIVACPRMTDPDNLGGLIRLCAGFGVTALALNLGCADPFSRRVLRVSMGNAFHLPMIDAQDLSADLARLRSEYGFKLAAAVLDDDARPLADMPAPSRLVLLLGNEADGLDPEWVAMCDEKVTIPMADQTDSLNVTVAAGIMLYHFTNARHSE